jgi:hypothetical protein
MTTPVFKVTNSQDTSPLGGQPSKSQTLQMLTPNAPQNLGMPGMAGPDGATIQLSINNNATDFGLVSGKTYTVSFTEVVPAAAPVAGA